MSDNPPADRPGHLDIDAVSAYVDRDFLIDDLTALERHLSQCPACHREVLEIHATVMLLAALPQYAPRRSFCLGREHASLRASRRHAAAHGASWVNPLFGLARAEGANGSGRFTGVLAGLQTAAVAIGALLVLVAVMDFGGIPTQAPLQLAVPTAMATTAAPPPPDVAEEQPALALQPEPKQAGGTADEREASDGMQAPAESAPAPRAATGAAAAVTEVVTPPTGFARQPDAAEPEQSADAQPAFGGESSPLGVAKIALAVVFFWLVVSIVGLRRMRG